jgi:hypothetical protein
MATQLSPVKKLLEAQYALKEAVLDEMADLQVHIRYSTDDAEIKDLKLKQDQLATQFRQLQTQSVVIIATETSGDLEIIKKLSSDVQAFVKATKSVAKTIRVVTALIVFVAATMGQDPQTIGKAAIAVYKAMNESIDAEAEKGLKAAFTIAPIKMPKALLDLAGSVAKAKPAKTR